MHIPAARARERNFWKENQELDGGKWKWSRPITSKSGFLEQLWFSPFSPHSLSLSHIAFLLSKKSPTLPHDRHPLAKINFTRTGENFSQIQMRTTFYSSSQFRKGSKFIDQLSDKLSKSLNFWKTLLTIWSLETIWPTLLYRTWNCIKIDASNSQKASLKKKQEFSSETLTHTHTPHTLRWLTTNFEGPIHLRSSLHGNNGVERKRFMPNVPKCLIATSSTGLQGGEWKVEKKRRKYGPEIYF